METGIYVGFEGMEGTGKSTASKLIYQRMQKSGLPVIYVREPGSTEVGERVRTLLAFEDLSPEAESGLFQVCRAQLISEIVRPTLQKGTHVVSDRTYGSNVAYQGFARGLSVEEIIRQSKFYTGGLFPHRTILIERPIEEALIAANKKRAGDSIVRFDKESEAFFTRVNQGFSYLADSDPTWRRVQYVDGEENLANAVWDELKDLYKL